MITSSLLTMALRGTWCRAVCPLCSRVIIVPAHSGDYHVTIIVVIVCPSALATPRRSSAASDESLVLRPIPSSPSHRPRSLQGNANGNCRGQRNPEVNKPADELIRVCLANYRGGRCAFALFPILDEQQMKTPTSDRPAEPKHTSL